MEPNALYMKPNMTVLVSLFCNIVYMASLFYLTYIESIDFKLLLLAYSIETASELMLIILYR